MLCICCSLYDIQLSCKAIVHPYLLLLNSERKPSMLSSWSNGMLEFISLWGIQCNFHCHILYFLWCGLILFFNFFRFQEIAGALDSALSAASLAPVQNSISDQGNSRVLTLKQSVTLLDSLKSCWREDVFLLSCSDKFLRLSLQLLSRSAWTANDSLVSFYVASLEFLFSLRESFFDFSLINFW